jgi:ABC-type sugar transport system ATPase subunit
MKRLDLPETAHTPALRVTGISKSFGTLKVLDGISFDPRC